MRALLGTLLSVVSLSLFAQGADLRVSVEGPPTTVRGATYSFRGTIENIGDAEARDVKVKLYKAGYGTPCMWEEPIGTMAPGEKRTYGCTADVALVSGEYVLYAVMIATSSTRDANPRDNSTQVIVDILTRPDLEIRTELVPTHMPGETATVRATFRNVSRVPANDVTITIDAPAGLVRVPDWCVNTGTKAICNVGTLLPSPRDVVQTIEVEAQTPDESAASYAVTFTISSPDGEEASWNNESVASGATFRMFSVTNRNDAGEGSLRAIMHTANSTCTGWPCMIAFAIDGPGGWQTITPETPLPLITATNLVINGETSPDTNAAGPDVEISGARLPSGNGFEVRSMRAEIRGLALNGFPENAILLTAPALYGSGGMLTVSGNYIGTDPTGNVAVPNRHGIRVRNERSPRDDSGRIGSVYRIENNVISGNQRSGIVLEDGLGSINGNVIGLNATVTAGLGNGASGIYVARTGGNADIVSNWIGFNTDFGIGVSRFADSVAIRWNSIQANRQGAIDIGLDGVTPPPIEITSARVENGTTIIEGTINALATRHLEVHFFANDAADSNGYSEGQFTLGALTLPGIPRAKTFRYVHPQELRGKWVTATVTTYSIGLVYPLISTSELSRAVEVP